MTSDSGDALLLTPGPLTTSRTVKQAMLHDWGSRDREFQSIVRSVLEYVPLIVNGAGTHVAVPMQGSGTFAIEAMLTTFVPRDGKVLVLVNGAYGRRAQRMLEIAGRAFLVHETPETEAPDPAAVEALVAADPSITHLFIVHCETTSGIRNPVEAIAAAAARQGRRLLIDGMSSFGALPLDATEVTFDALATCANKCLEGIPGLGLVLCRREALAETEGNATTLVLDLADQWQALEQTGQFRFTPPTHVVAACHQALQEFHAEGGVSGRGARYAANFRTLIDGMRALGFTTVLEDAVMAPIIATFHLPSDDRFDFQRLYQALKDRGFIIYPGKLTRVDSFRIGCVGRLYPRDLGAAVAAIDEILQDMGIRLPPAAAA